MFVVAVFALGPGHHPPAPALTSAAAVRALLHDPQIARALHSIHWTRTDLAAIDSGTVHVNLYRGNELVFLAAVRTNGSVEAWMDGTAHVPYGSPIAYRPIVLLGLAAMFVLMTGVAPLARIRNLDVAAVLVLTAPMVLRQHGYLGAATVTAALALGYLGFRCLRVALAERSAEPHSQVPLYEVVTSRLSVAERVHVLRMLAVAAAVVFLMVGASSIGVDVIYAAMEGATAIVHGLLPYGHLGAGDVIHPDTYPILSYALYAPLAFLTPVSSTFDSVDSALVVTVFVAIVGAVATLLCVCASGRAAGREPRRAQADGLRAALAVLSFPPLLAIVSSGTTDVTVGVMLVVAVALWRRPAASAAVLAIAGWVKLAPFTLIPVWLAPLRGRRLMAAVAAIAAVTAACIGLVVALGGPTGIGAMLRAIAYQFSRGAYQSVWHTLGAQALQPYAEAAVLALIAGLTVTLRTRGEGMHDPRRLAGVAAAVLIAVQLAANYWAFLYLAWIIPLLVLSLLAPEAATAPVTAVSSREFSPTAQLLGSFSRSRR